MSLPAILAQIINLLYSVIDRVYIGNMDPSGHSLAGIGIASSVILLVSALASLAGGGGSPLASRALGANDKPRAEKILGNVFTMLLVLSVISGLLIYFLRNPLLLFCGASSNTYGPADEYLSMYLLGTPFVLLALGLNPFLTCQGKARHAMISVIIGAVLNIGLDPLFIFVFNMGVRGAALATILSQGVSAVFELIVLFSKKTSLRIKKENLMLSPRIVGEICGLGVAPFVMASTECIIGVILNRNLSSYGDNYVTTLTILQSCMLIITTPLTGLTSGVTPIIAYNYGMKSRIRVVETIKKSGIVFCSYTAFFALLMMIFPTLFGHIFTQNEEILSLVSKYMPIFIFGMLVFGIQRTCQCAFLSLGQAKISLFVAILRKIILLVPFVYLLQYGFNMGVNGIYLAEGLADTLASLTTGTIFLFKIKKILATIEPNSQKEIAS